jgi:hypothetical protein
MNVAESVSRHRDWIHYGCRMCSDFVVHTFLAVSTPASISAAIFGHTTLVYQLLCGPNSRMCHCVKSCKNSQRIHHQYYRPRHSSDHMKAIEENPLITNVKELQACAWCSTHPAYAYRVLAWQQGGEGYNSVVGNGNSNSGIHGSKEGSFGSHGASSPSG